MAKRKEKDSVISINFTLKKEGTKFTNDHEDRGGPTRHGVCLNFDKNGWRRAFGEELTEERIKTMPQSDAALFYWEDDWKRKAHADKLPWPVNLVVFDAIVNHGRGGINGTTTLSGGGVWLQRVVGATADGIIGPKTIKAVERMVQGDPKKALQLAHDFNEKRKRFYIRIVARNESQRKYLSGWMTRLLDIQALAFDRDWRGY